VAAIAALTTLRESYDRGLAPKPAAQPAAPIGMEELSEYEAKKLLVEAGVPLLPERLARSAAEAVSAAVAVGYPVAMKVVSPQIAHKTEIGGVLLGVENAAGVESGYELVMQRACAAVPGARIDGVLVAPMAPAGVDTIVGVHRDATFGPVVMFGLGGVFVEVLKDVTFRLAPFDETDARRMIAQIAGYALLDGARGMARADVDALARVLARISQFAASHADDIESIDINPLRVLPEGRGVVALDALIVPGRADANPSSGEG